MISLQKLPDSISSDHDFPAGVFVIGRYRENDTFPKFSQDCSTAPPPHPPNSFNILLCKLLNEYNYLKKLGSGSTH